MDWVRALAVDQLEFYWNVHLWPRLQGLTDDEYFWEPVAGAWSVRADSAGRFVLDGSPQPPDPPPVTTIGWRMVRIAVGIFYTRASTFFGDGSVPDDANMFDPRHEPAALPGTAADALALLERSYQWWHDGLLTLDEAALVTPIGPRGAFFAQAPFAHLVLHLNREAMHHGGEIGVLRDLYRATGARSRDDRLVVRRGAHPAS